MRLSIEKSSNTKQFYIIESFTTKTGKRTSRSVEKLGNELETYKLSKILSNNLVLNYILLLWIRRWW